MNHSLSALLVSVSLFTSIGVAQSQSRNSLQSKQNAHGPVAQINAKALLTASNGTPKADFGMTSIAVNSTGNIIVVGAPLQNSFSGGVYVYARPATGWANATETAQLIVPGLLKGSELGYAVAISSDGNTIVASSPQAGTGDSTIYVFSPTGGSWSNGGTILAELTTSDVGAFMRSLAISSNGQTIVAGAQFGPNYEGAVYVYSKPASGWTNMTQTAKLTVAAPHLFQALGYSVAIDGNTIAAGAADNQGGSPGPGGVYVYQKPASGWADGTETAALLASDGQRSDMLGFSIGISANTIVAGAPQHQGGVLYVFVKPTSGWANAVQNAELTSASAGTLGQSIAVSGSLIIGGAPGTAIHPSGEVCVYAKPATGWTNNTETYDLIAKADTPDGGLGWSASLTSTGPVAIAGADFENKGGVFVFGK